jgi:hypothetical protein
MKWSWWSAELADAVTDPHSPGFPSKRLYERKKTKDSSSIIEFSVLQDARTLDFKHR